MNYASEEKSAGPARSEYAHEKASREWAGAKSRLQEAQADSNRACAELSAAQSAEEQAWTALQDSAGRGIPQPPSMPPPNGYRARG